MESSAGLVAGSHNRNEFVRIRHEGEAGLKPLNNMHGQVCQICGDTALLATWEVFVACNECAFPICRPCYQYERKVGTHACPQCKTRYKRHKWSPRVNGEEEEEEEEEDAYDLDNEFNYVQGIGKAARQWELPGKGEDVDLSSSRHVIPRLTNGLLGG